MCPPRSTTAIVYAGSAASAAFWMIVCTSAAVIWFEGDVDGTGDNAGVTPPPHEAITEIEATATNEANRLEKVFAVMRTEPAYNVATTPNLVATSPHRTGRSM